MNEKYAKFKGIFPALLTPFGADGKPDYEALGALIRYTLGKGVAGYYVGGSTGEVFLLTPEERRGVYAAAAKEAKGKATLIGHVGDLSTDAAVGYAKYCEELGYDAVSSVVPFYFKYSAQQIITYYKTLADAVNIPVLLYHIPALSGVSVGMDVFDALLSDDRFMGVKYTSNDYFLFERLRNRYPDKILYNGYDEMFACGMAMGADGAIGSTYNLMGERFTEIYQTCLDNDFIAARKMQHEANDIIAALIEAGDVKASLKYAISECVGIPMGLCRAPGGDVPEDWKKKFMAEYGDKFIKA
ncbi:MAG: N-acetylneuraminate lyase [Clostridia bacterium]|nr:N-acetylneuraminate lyase [Clostridia bacterium]